MRKRIGSVFLLILLFLSGWNALVAGNSLPQEQSVSPEALDTAIDEVLLERHFQWRMPRDPAAEDQQVGALERFLESILETTMRAWKAVRRWYSKIRDWMRLQRPAGTGSQLDTSMGQKLPWVIGATILVAILLIWMVFRWRKGKTPLVEEAHALQGPLPEISQEDITADLLPEEGWLNMARDLFGKGEARLALRALFMAILADLSHRGKITISRFKSNQEYMKELHRRTHYVPDLGRAFSDNVRLLERVWYGDHPVTQEVIQGFQENQDRIKRKDL